MLFFFVCVRINFKRTNIHKHIWLYAVSTIYHLLSAMYLYIVHWTEPNRTPPSHSKLNVKWNLLCQIQKVYCWAKSKIRVKRNMLSFQWECFGHPLHSTDLRNVLHSLFHWLFHCTNVDHWAETVTPFGSYNADSWPQLFLYETKNSIIINSSNWLSHLSLPL